MEENMVKESVVCNKQGLSARTGTELTSTVIVKFMIRAPTGNEELKVSIN